ncbi:MULTISPECIES: hypothetical protein [unclassified Synechococcus]|uniref:hypothetical protein n=1 Tax=unclassified Synechococcus TaxID=2626047 RepID=UPI0039AFAFEC
MTSLLILGSPSKSGSSSQAVEVAETAEDQRATDAEQFSINHPQNEQLWNFGEKMIHQMRRHNRC